MKKFLVCLFLCLLILPSGVVNATTATTTEETTTESSGGNSNEGSDGSWCSVKMSQGSLGYPAGCTGCTVSLIVQNSLTLTDSKYQLEGDITSSSAKNWSNWNSIHTSFGIEDENYYLSSVSTGFSGGSDKYCGGSFIGADDINGFKTHDYITGSMATLVGMGDKDFVNMSDEELRQAFAAIWNNGYWAVVAVAYVQDGVTYKAGITPETWKANKSIGQITSGNGSGSYTSRHWTMLAGVDSTDIYINDPATCSIRKMSESTAGSNYGNYPYKIVYACITKNNKNSPIDLAGGKKAGGSDGGGGNDLGMSYDAFMGFDEDAFSSYCKLGEIDLTDLMLEADISNLNNDELVSLDDWKIMTEQESDLIKILRRCVMIVGILFVVWGILFYCAFWFDRINTYFDLDLLGILSLGRLRRSDTDEECTFRMTDQPKSEARTINHKYCLIISITAIAFGVFMVSGLLFLLVRKIVNFVQGFLH